ncbi:GSCOCG00004157001-RA-CDS, partial [Cotesia congregata]
LYNRVLLTSRFVKTTSSNISHPLNNIRTLKPDGANGTSKFIEIGGLVHFFFVSVSSKSISADN